MATFIGREYIPSLDGLRAFSILLVIFSHFGLEHIVPGGFGVTVFFFISGLIITRLLLKEYLMNGSIALAQFYIRRFLRLGPALLVYIGIASAFVFFSINRIEIAELLSALFYSGNYYNIYVGYSKPYPYLILWSLAVEEHYYIFYPLLTFIIFKDYKKALILLGLLVLTVLIWRIYLVYGLHVKEDRTYMGSDTRIDSIIYGAILAILLAMDKKEKLVTLFSNNFVMVGATLLLLSTFIFRDEFFRETTRYSMQGIALTILICSLVFSAKLKKLRWVFETRALIYVGKLSYSLYLYHWLGKMVADWMRPTTTLSWVGIATAIAVAGAVLSYHVVERRMIRFRRAYGSHVS